MVMLPPWCNSLERRATTLAIVRFKSGQDVEGIDDLEDRDKVTAVPMPISVDPRPSSTVTGSIAGCRNGLHKLVSQALWCILVIPYAVTVYSCHPLWRKTST